MKQKKPVRRSKTKLGTSLKNKRGTLSMARTQEIDSATSQFFINLKDNDFLDHGTADFGYAVFAQVTGRHEWATWHRNEAARKKKLRNKHLFRTPARRGEPLQQVGRDGPGRWRRRRGVECRERPRREELLAGPRRDGPARLCEEQPCDASTTGVDDRAAVHLGRPGAAGGEPGLRGVTAAVSAAVVPMDSMDATGWQRAVVLSLRLMLLGSLLCLAWGRDGLDAPLHPARRRTAAAVGHVCPRHPGRAWRWRPPAGWSASGCRAWLGRPWLSTAGRPWDPAITV